MLKKLLVVAGLVGAATLVVKKVKASSDERALWHEATTAPDLRYGFSTRGPSSTGRAPPLQGGG
jgi:hypothetical protein